MWQQEAPVVTAAAEPEAGRDGEQLRQPAGLGGRALGEPGSAPQEPRGQCELRALQGGRWAEEKGLTEAKRLGGNCQSRIGLGSEKGGAALEKER